MRKGRAARQGGRARPTAGRHENPDPKHFPMAINQIFPLTGDIAGVPFLFILIVVTVVGAIIGSFLNVVIHRVPREAYQAAASNAGREAGGATVCAAPPVCLVMTAETACPARSMSE